MNKLNTTLWVVWLGTFITMCVLLGPIVDSSFDMIKATTLEETVERVDHKVCWKTYFEKQRTGQPAAFLYTVHDLVDPAMRDIPVAAYKKGTHEFLTTYNFAQHTSGQRWTSNYCVDLPQPIELSHPLMLTGYAIYDVHFRPWKIRQLLPNVNVPPVTQ